ncbi:MAG: hypothetical protein ING29_10650 [Azospirillum sp.]|nr:hypothetical protein [Azospirillum sp.]
MAQAESVLSALGRPAAIFALALAARLAYIAWQGATPAGAFYPDSVLFVEIALSADWWKGTADRMPLYPLFLGGLLRVFGAEAYWAPLAAQAVADAAACVAIARTAELLRPGAGRWAGPLAALNPTQIAMAGVLLGDSLFVASLAFAFLALARWWLGQGGAAAVGFWFGLALFNRAIVWPFLPVLGAAMLLAGLRRGEWRAAPIALAIVGLFAAPVFARNWMVWDAPALTAQGPMHMALWWYPLVKEAHDGTPYALTAAEVAAAFAARPGGTGGFANAATFGDLARERLATLPVSAFVKAWLAGAAINLAAPATIAVPSVMLLPRTGFYATEGAGPVEKAVNFLTRSSSAPYIAWLAAGLAIEWPIRLLALAGLFFAMRARADRAAAFFAVAWIGFILAIQGPVAGPKYRLPIEPILVVFAGGALARGPRADADSR